MGLRLAPHEETRHVPRIDGLQQDLDAVRRGPRRGVAHVGHVGGMHLGRRGPGRHDACDDVDARALQRARVVQCQRYAFAELPLPPRVAGHAPLAGVPVARRRVEQHLLQSGIAQALADLLRRPGVGEEALHPLEAVGGSGRETVEEGQVVVEQRNVGGEAGHSVKSARPSSVRSKS